MFAGNCEKNGSKTICGKSCVTVEKQQCSVYVKKIVHTETRKEKFKNGVKKIIFLHSGKK